MIGRKEEMAQLEEQCASGKFEFTVMYGRRRVGKTTILQEFSVAHNVIFYSAQEKNDSMNLQDFSKTIQTYFDQDGLSSFLSWKDALEYISSRLKAERTILIIDEFPFLAGPNPSIKSLFQHEIDHVWKNKNLFLSRLDLIDLLLDQVIRVCNLNLINSSTGSSSQRSGDGQSRQVPTGREPLNRSRTDGLFRNSGQHTSKRRESSRSLSMNSREKRRSQFVAGKVGSVKDTYGRHLGIS